MPALTIKHVKALTQADFTGTVTVGNSSGGTASALATDLARPSDWNSAHTITFSLSASDVSAVLFAGNGISFSTLSSGITVAQQAQQFMEPFPFANSNSVTISYSSNVWALDPMDCPQGLISGHFRLFNMRDSSHFLNTISANSASLGGYSLTGIFKNRLAIYSQGAGTDATRLNSLWTGQGDISFTQSQTFTQSGAGGTAVGVSQYMTIGMITNVDVSGGASTSTQTTSGSVSTGATSMAATKADVALGSALHNWFTGSCMDMVPFASTIAPGAYWLAYMHGTDTGGGGTTGINRTTAGTWFNATQTRAGIIDVNLSVFKKLGAATSANSSSMGFPFHGSLLTQSSLATASLGSANLQHTTRRVYWNFVQGSM